MCCQPKNKCCKERLISRSALVLHPIDNVLAVMAPRLVFWKEEVHWGKVHGSQGGQLGSVLCFFNKLFLLITGSRYRGTFRALFRSLLLLTRRLCQKLHPFPRTVLPSLENLLARLA